MKRFMKRFIYNLLPKCLPCSVHGQAKTLAELVDPLILARQKEEARGGGTSSAQDFYLALNRVEVMVEFDIDNDRGAIRKFSNGIYEFYRSPLEPRPRYSAVYVRRLK